MPQRIRAVFFDVDGVLIDSLPQHLQVCRDKAKEFGLSLQIPTPDVFRRMVSQGTKVSPMRNFFLAVGFPEKMVDRAAADYERDFADAYRPAMFDGAERTLAALARAGFRLGIVTSNTRSNVEPILGESIRHFEPDALFFFDPRFDQTSKSMQLVEGLRRIRVPALSCVYVGDQPSDERAARECGAHFLGVTYGWGIVANSTEVRDFSVVHSIDEIPAAIARW